MKNKLFMDKTLLEQIKAVRKAATEALWDRHEIDGMEGKTKLEKWNNFYEGIDSYIEWAYTKHVDRCAETLPVPVTYNWDTRCGWDYDDMLNNWMFGWASENDFRLAFQYYEGQGEIRLVGYVIEGDKAKFFRGTISYGKKGVQIHGFSNLLTKHPHT